MSEMFIVPMQIGRIDSGMTGAAKGQENSGISAFKSIFENALGEVKDTENELAVQQYKLVTGQTNDPSEVTVAAAEAQMSIEMLVALKNKALESYNTLINMNI